MSRTLAIVYALAAVTALLAPTHARAQQPWTVTFTPTVNPLAIGGCGPVRLTLLDPATKAWPRNPAGNFVALSDFDLSVTGVDPTGVAGEYNGPSIWSACACQGATVGSAATVTATYPAAALSPKQRVPGVTVQTSSTFTIAAPRASTDVVPCQTLKGQALTASAPSTVRPRALPSGTVPASVAGSAGVAAVGDALVPQTVQPQAGTPAVMVVNGTTMRAMFVEGGSATAVVSSANGGVAPTGAARYEPIVVDVEPGGPMDAIINAAWSGTPTAVSGSVRRINTYKDAGGTIVPNLPVFFTSAQITSTTIPTLYAAGIGGAMPINGLRVSLAPATTTGGPTANVAIPPGKSFSNRNVKFDIPGIQSANVIRIESFVVGGATASSTQLGVQRIVITLASTIAPDWIAWLNSSVASGWSASSEKTLTLELMSSTLSHLATIQGDGVGIVAVRHVIIGGGGAGQLASAPLAEIQAELYVRHIHLLP